MTFKREVIPQYFAFELSNRCNYAQYHLECPVDAKAGPIFLDTNIIKDIIKYFGCVNYTGRIEFNIYNEPLIDPRLFMLLEYNREHCGCEVCIYTNGWGLNQYMVNELSKLNVILRVSYYTDKEEERLSKLNNNGHPVYGSRIVFDTMVKTVYESFPTQSGLCFFPSIYGMVNHKGEYVLCCRDYEYHYVFGDLNITSLKEILISENRQKICDGLEAGDRILDLCKQCPFPGWGVKNGQYAGMM